MDRRRFVLEMIGAATTCAACGEASGRGAKGSCGDPGDGGGLGGTCEVDARVVRFVGGAHLSTNQVMLTGIDASNAAIVARDEKGFYALSAVCPHACCVVMACNDSGCTAPIESPTGCDTPRTTTLVRTGAPAFSCPCHQSAFGPDGALLQGPSTKPLAAVSMRIEGDDVLVDLSTPVSPDVRVGG